MKVGDLISGKVVAVEPGRSLRDAARTMAQYRVGSVVVQDDDKLAGILTERDVVRAMADGIDPDATGVEKLMTSEVVTIPPDWEIYEAAAEMGARRIRHLVVAKDDELLGVLSIRDMLLAGQRVQFADGNWASLRNPATFTARERKLLHRCLLKLRASGADPDVTDLMGLMVGSWSFDEALPGESEDSLRAIPDADATSLSSAVLDELPDLQRAVHPAPGWRRRR